MQRLPPGTCPGGQRDACPGGTPPATPPLTRPTPANAAALRSTSLATAWQSGMTPALARRFGPPAPAPGWRIPQALPATDPISAVVRSLMAEQQRSATPATGRRSG